MTKTVLKFGLLSGLVIAATMAITLPMCLKGNSWVSSEVIGYSSMLLAFLLVFFGIRSYREHDGGGAITFGRAVGVGLLITVISCGIYVASWEIVYFNFIPDFADRYSAHVIEKARKEGASDAALLKKQQEMADFKRLYANPAINIGMTFMEAFPVGLIVTLISAAILRKKPGEGTPAAVAVA